MRNNSKILSEKAEEIITIMQDAGLTPVEMIEVLWMANLKHLRLKKQKQLNK